MREYKNLVKDILFGHRRFLKYRIGTSLLLVLIVLPLIKHFLIFFMNMAGFNVIANEKIGNFLMSPYGIIYILLVLIIFAIVHLLEAGGLILMSQQILLRKHESSFLEVLKKSTSRLKNLFGLSGFLIIFYGFALLPWFNIGLSNKIFDFIEIPEFIYTYIRDSSSLNMMLKAISILFVIYSIKWFFALHYIMLKDYTAKKALISSSLIVRKHLRIFYKRIIVVTLLYLCTTGIFFIISFLVVYILYIVGSNIGVDKSFFSGLSLVVAVVNVFLYNIFIGSMQVLYSTKLFFEVEKISEEILVSKVKNSSVLDNFTKSKLFKFLISVIVILASISNGYTYDNSHAKIEITAHRGDTLNTPENTMSAILYAIGEGADFVEIDVQRTKDDKIVLFHDYSMNRIMNVDKKIGEFTLKELKEYDVGSWFSKDFENERIVTLEEVIEKTKQKIKLNIEIKSEKLDPKLVEETIRIVNKYNLEKSCVITSLRYDTLELVEMLNENIKTGYIIVAVLGNIEELNVDFYSIEATMVTEYFVLKAKNLNKEVHVWTVNYEDQMVEMISIGVDNIITDKVKLLKSIIN